MEVPSLNVRHVIDYRPAPRILPNEEALKKLHSGRRSKSGIKQSEHSKKRQNFITGMDADRMSPHEQRLRREYMEEWHARMRGDES
jgi:hypothetical protein